MKLAAIALCLMLTGCAGLNVSWQLTASYKTQLQTRALTEHGLEAPAPVAAPPKPIEPGKPS